MEKRGTVLTASVYTISPVWHQVEIERYTWLFEWHFFLSRMIRLCIWLAALFDGHCSILRFSLSVYGFTITSVPTTFGLV
ncbi:hypothetical protein M413DRAFT_447083 [Hebeloma cylindrosporum]|uniref:Uncharacterized protein n=1 Tax=Hebeloma cylindrosporum TaxID=76867 RepID=A0A0C2YF29_HEBCY|nr:hypothetical protein M413DRAFT_447083 [Hebeloma cylindrosporum h7]